MTDVVDVLDHQRPAPDVTRRMEKHITVRWHRYWCTLSLLESKRHPDPAARYYFLRVRFQSRLRALRAAGIIDRIIRRDNLDDPRPDDAAFEAALQGAKRRKHVTHSQRNGTK